MALLKEAKSEILCESRACANNCAGFSTKIVAVAKIAKIPITINNSINVNPFFMVFIDPILYGFYFTTFLFIVFMLAYRVPITKQKGVDNIGHPESFVSLLEFEFYIPPSN